MEEEGNFTKRRNLSWNYHSAPFHSGLDLAHVVHSVEWLAQLHALSYVVLNRHSGGPAAWLSENRYTVILIYTPTSNQNPDMNKRS